MLDKELSIRFRLSDNDKPLTFDFCKYTSINDPSGFTAIYEINDQVKCFDRMFFSKQIEHKKYLNIDITSHSFHKHNQFEQLWQSQLATLYKAFLNYTNSIIDACGECDITCLNLGIFEKSEQQPVICEQHEEFLKKYSGWYVLICDEHLYETTRHLQKELQKKHIYNCYYSSEGGQLYLFLRKITVSTFLLAINRICYLKNTENGIQRHLREQSELYFKSAKIFIPISAYDY
jgi:hypothetical protein